MKTILAAVDFSDAARNVIAVAREHAQALGAGLLVLHVVEPVASYVPVGAAMDVIETTPPPVLAQDLENHRARLARMVGEPEGVQTLAVLGLAADDIVAQAREHGAAMIVLGSHGHGALYHLFAGSVVTGVLRRAHVPVLVVPIGARD